MAKYRVIDISQMDKALQPYVESTVRATLSPNDVVAIAGSNEWTFKPMHILGEKRAVVMCFRGMEVALFFKRHTINIDSENTKADPLPEARMDDPEKAWIRIELFHTKAVKNRGTWITSELDYLRDENQALKGLNKAQEVELEGHREAAGKVERRANNVPEIKRKIRLLQKMLDKATAPVKKQYHHYHPKPVWKNTSKKRRKKLPRTRKKKS